MIKPRTLYRPYQTKGVWERTQQDQVCCGCDLRGDDRDRGNQTRVTLETGVSTRQPIAWIDLGVDEGGKKVDSE